jgi:adenine-specific DNA-methyltransferase
MAQNRVDGGNRRYVLVQLPEPLDPDVKNQKAAAEYCDELGKPRTIAELTKERLRRAAAMVRVESPEANSDFGFRVFKLDSTNIREWDTAPEDLEAELELHTEHIKEGRSEADILYELLLKLGLDLCVPMEERTVSAGKRKHRVTAIGGGVLMACLSESITRADVETLGLALASWHKELSPVGETTCVFRDSAFEDDVAKTNMAAILTQHGFTRVRSL